MHPINNSEEFLHKFGDITIAGFNTPVMLTDVRIGFSVQKDYPQDIRFKSARNIKGDLDNVAVIWAVYESKGITNEVDLVPIRFRIAMMSKYRSKHFDYDYDDPNCPTKDSVAISFNSPKPLDLDLNDSYFYSRKRGVLVDESDHPVEGVSILNEIFIAHCNSVHPIKGAGIRAKAFFSQLPVKVISLLISSIIFILQRVFGRTLDESRDRSSYLDGYLSMNFKVTGNNFIELAGYKASKPVIVLYAILVALFCWLVLPVNDDTYLGNLIQSDFLLLIHTILFLVILDSLMPIAIFRVLNLLIKLRKQILNGLLSRF